MALGGGGRVTIAVAVYLASAGRDPSELRATGLDSSEAASPPTDPPFGDRNAALERFNGISQQR
jgi:hypothetical protein